jgi:antitoxin VapB
MPKAKLFTNGGSQAVRLPAEFRFEGDDVDVRRDPVSGDVILSKPRGSWDDYFAWVATLDLPADFMAAREQPLDAMRDPLAHSTTPSANKRR